MTVPPQQLEDRGLFRITDRVEVRPVAWDDADAARLRDAMTAEISPRYADRAESMPVPAEMAVDPRDVVYVGTAHVDGRAVGQIVLRRLPTAAGRSGENPPPELEIKRMFVDAAARGRGVGRALLAAAEHAAMTAGARRVVLQTGDRQPDAVALYERAGYERVPVFAPYLALPYSNCFAKTLPCGQDR